MAPSRRSLRIKQSLRTAVAAVGKRVPFVLDLARSAVAALRLQRFRRLSAEYPVDPRVVVFECYAGRAYSCSPRALYRAMLADERYRDYEFIWAFKAPITRALKASGCTAVGLDGFHAAGEFKGSVAEVFGESALAELGRATLVAFGSPEYFRSYARAGTWISNAIVPTHFRPRPGQVYVQCWHGTPLKRLGCDIPLGKSNAMFSVPSIHRRYRAEGKRFTHLLSPSAFASEKLGTAFDLAALGRAGAIVEEGYPRNDFLTSATDADAAAIKHRLGIPEGKRVVLYAPTWRDDQHVSGLGYTFEANVDFDGLQRDLGDGYVILFRAHYLIANSFDFAKYPGFLYDVSAVSDINDLYVISDLLVTDYSSVFFDFANLGRPIVFYMYDLEAYAEDLRGFYLGLDELPGPVVRTQEELVATINACEAAADAPDEYRLFQKRFTYLDDGHASERVLARVAPPVGSVR